MNPLEIFGAGFGCGALMYFIAFGAPRKRSVPRAIDLSDPGETIMAISADIQAQLDRLNQVPAQIAATKANAVQAALTAQAQDHADEVSALTSATDAVVSAATAS